jgi:hypothetical protein
MDKADHYSTSLVSVCNAPTGSVRQSPPSPASDVHALARSLFRRAPRSQNLGWERREARPYKCNTAPLARRGGTNPGHAYRPLVGSDTICNAPTGSVRQSPPSPASDVHALARSLFRRAPRSQNLGLERREARPYKCNTAPLARRGGTNPEHAYRPLTLFDCSSHWNQHRSSWSWWVLY